MAKAKEQQRGLCPDCGKPMKKGQFYDVVGEPPVEDYYCESCKVRWCSYRLNREFMKPWGAKKGEAASAVEGSR